MSNALYPSPEGILQSFGDKIQLTGNAEVILSAAKQSYDFARTYSIQSPCKQNNSDVKGIQRAIKNLQNDISQIKRFTNINSAIDALINEDVEPGRTIKKIVTVATGDISGYVKNILGRVRGWALNEIQGAVKKTLPMLFPSEMPSFLTRVNAGTNALSCAFAKLLRGLAGTVGSLLLQLIDQYINGPICMVEDFIGNLLDQILGPIEEVISGLVSAFSRTATQLVANVFQALDFATGLLNFFQCDDDKKCPTQDEITRGGEGIISGKGGDPPGMTNGFSSPSDGGGPKESVPGPAYVNGQSHGGSPDVDLKITNPASGVDFGTIGNEQSISWELA